MRLSEAIRLGGMLHPQCVGKFFGDRERTAVTPLDRSQIRETCALGGAWLVAGGSSHDEVITETRSSPRGFARAGQRVTILDYPAEWMRVLSAVVLCPEITCPGHGPLDGAIQHLNDDHRWTREQIADFVETIERERASLNDRSDTPQINIQDARNPVG